MSEGLDPGFELLPNPAPVETHRRHGRLIASIVAVVALGGGGTAAYVAFAGKDSAGSASPQAAVQKMVDDLQRADLLSFVNDLAPGERTALSAPLRDDVSSLKRLGVLTGNANLAAVPGFSFKAHNLVYADKTVQINDHVQVVQITGGSIDVGADIAKLPLTKRILQLAGSSRHATSEHQTIDSADPVRIAAQQVGKRWYASLFYTAADDASDHARPTASDAIPAHGASSPKAAISAMVQDLIAGNVRSALELVSPDELGAVHDYGALILRNAPQWHAANVHIKTLDLTTTGISGGAVRVGLHKLVVDSDGQQFSLTLSNGCATIAAAGFHQKVCAANAAKLITTFLGAASCGVQSGTGVFRSASGSGKGQIGATGYAPLNSASNSSSSGSSAYGSVLQVSPTNTGKLKHHVDAQIHGGFDRNAPKLPTRTRYGSTPLEFTSCDDAFHFTKAQQRAITDVFTSITKIGIVADQVGGSWYIAPVRTLADIGGTVLSGMKGDDLFQLAKLGD